MKPKTAEEVFAILREFFAGPGGLPNSEQLKVWNVLTALRGPDNSNGQVKYATTSVIRQALLGSRSGVQDHVSIYADNNANILERERLKNHDDFSALHFYIHAREAFTSLGLSWDEVNKERT